MHVNMSKKQRRDLHLFSVLIGVFLEEFKEDLKCRLYCLNCYYSILELYLFLALI